MSGSITANDSSVCEVLFLKAWKQQKGAFCKQVVGR